MLLRRLSQDIVRHFVHIYILDSKASVHYTIISPSKFLKLASKQFDIYPSSIFEGESSEQKLISYCIITFGARGMRSGVCIRVMPLGKTLSIKRIQINVSVKQLIPPDRMPISPVSKYEFGGM